MPRTAAPILLSALLIAPLTGIPAASAASSQPGHGAAVTRTAGAQAQATRMARSYLDYTAFSRTGLIEQLEFEGFPTRRATRAVDSIRVSWKKQAAKKAADYLDMMAFSRSGLIEQLKFEGFTSAQASYGVRAVGL